MKKFTILSFVLLTSCVGTSLFAAEGSGSSSSASSSGDHASSSSGAADAHMTVLRKLIESPEFRAFNEQVDVYRARLRDIVTAGEFSLFSKASMELAFTDVDRAVSRELMRMRVLHAISNFLAQVVPGTSVTTVKQFAHNLLLIAQLSEDALLSYGKDFEENCAFLFPLWLVNPMEINLELLRALKKDAEIFGVVTTTSALADDQQMARNIRAKLTAAGVKYWLLPVANQVIFSKMVIAVAQLRFYGNLFERIDY
jgi:hypothetical protein